MVNIIGEIPGETKTMILLASHYDTKYFKDMQFLGANDPASSVATLLEIGRVLGSQKEKPKVTYRLVFFDGEEAFCEGWDQCGSEDHPDNTYGSRHYVTQLQAKNELGRVRAMILLDMIGYSNQQFGRDSTSTSWLLDIVWRVARDLGHGSIFLNRQEGVGGDDHEPFLSAGVDSLDIIQLNTYRSSSGDEYWHTEKDTLDKISARSLKIT